MAHFEWSQHYGGPKCGSHDYDGLVSRNWRLHHRIYLLLALEAQ